MVFEVLFVVVGVGVVVVIGVLLGLVAGVFYFRVRGKVIGFGFFVF